MSTARILQPLISYTYTAPETVAVFEQNKWDILSPTSFQQKFNTTLTHGLVSDAQRTERAESLKKKISAEYKPNTKEKELDIKARAFMQKPINYFSVCYANKTCQYGLIANQDIPAQTVVGTYSAELLIRKSGDAGISYESNNDKAYDMGAGNYFSSVLVENHTPTNFTVSFRALNHGDLTRFALHAPSEYQINFLKGNHFLHDSINASQILHANVAYATTVYDGFPMNCFVTTAAIKKYDMVLINYGDSYWRNGRAPLVESPICRQPAIPMPGLLYRATPNSSRLSFFTFDKYSKKYTNSQEDILLPDNEPTLTLGK